MVPRHTTIAVRTELRSAVVMEAIDDKKKPPRMHEKDERWEQNGKFKTINAQKMNWEAKILRQKEVEISDEYRKNKTWKGRSPLGHPRNTEKTFSKSC